MPKKVSKETIKEPDIEDIEGVITKRKKRHTPTKESVAEEFEELVATIENEIKRLRKSPEKTKGIKFLRSLGKNIKTLRGHSIRVMKQKPKINRKHNPNSGFLKPVQISKDVTDFTGWDPEGLRSRVDVTKYICKYIHDNNLQNPSDRRQIIADKKLSNLLGYNPKTDKIPLTYFRIQTYMKKHFTNPSK